MLVKSILMSIMSQCIQVNINIFITIIGLKESYLVFKVKQGDINVITNMLLRILVFSLLME